MTISVLDTSFIFFSVFFFLFGSNYTGVEVVCFHSLYYACCFVEFRKL
jgi:hypothetical protein